MKSTLKPFAFLGALFCALFALSACNESTTGTTSSSSSSSLTASTGNVTLSALSDDTLTVRMPASLFGSSDTDIQFSTISVWVNDAYATTLAGEKLNYISSTGNVSFSVSSINDGDMIVLVVSAQNGGSQAFYGTVSDSAAVTASLSADAAVSEEEEEEESDVTATFGQLSSENKSLIIIPLEAFGGATDDLDEATIDVTLNSELIAEDLSATTYYSATYDAVRFYLADLEDGDVLRFDLHLEDGTTVRFYGEISADSDTSVTES